MFFQYFSFFSFRLEFLLFFFFFLLLFFVSHFHLFLITIIDFSTHKFYTHLRLIALWSLRIFNLIFAFFGYWFWFFTCIPIFFNFWGSLRINFDIFRFWNMINFGWLSCILIRSEKVLDKDIGVFMSMVGCFMRNVIGMDLLSTLRNK